MSVSTAQIPGEGVTLGPHLFLPDDPGPHPAVTMACGFGDVKEGVERFAGIPGHRVRGDRPSPARTWC
ncbi:hypothetical protein ACWDE0_35005 [Streptomyces sp. 900105755]